MNIVRLSILSVVLAALAGTAYAAEPATKPAEQTIPEGSFDLISEEHAQPATMPAAEEGDFDMVEPAVEEEGSERDFDMAVPAAEEAPARLADDPAPSGDFKLADQATDKPAANPLKIVIPQVKFVETPVKDIIAFLREATGANFAVTWPEVPADDQISLTLRNATLETILRALIENVNADGLDFILRDNVIVIGSKHRLKPAPPTAAEQAGEATLKFNLVSDMKQAYFDPEAMVVAVVGGLRSELGLSDADLKALLEKELLQAKSLGARNAIRLTLKDLYLRSNDAAKAKQVYLDMLADNDAAIGSAGKK